MIILPANAEYILVITQNISFFNMLQEENVQLFLKKHIFSRVQLLQEILINQGTGFMMICFLVVAFVVLAVFQKYAKDSPLFIKLKNKLMWSSVFRSVIQTYLPTCLAVFTIV